jgi:hypothetical protein
METFAYWLGYCLPAILGISILIPCLRSKKRGAWGAIGMVIGIFLICLQLISMVGSCRADEADDRKAKRILEQRLKMTDAKYDAEMLRASKAVTNNCPIEVDGMTTIIRSLYIASSNTLQYTFLMKVGSSDLTPYQWGKMKMIQIENLQTAGAFKVWSKGVHRNMGLKVMWQYTTLDGKFPMTITYDSSTGKVR